LAAHDRVAPSSPACSRSRSPASSRN
jgi:hypothetical protein